MRTKEEYLAEERGNAHAIHEIEQRMAKDATELAILKARRKELITEAVNMVQAERFQKEGVPGLVKDMMRYSEKR